MRSWNEDLQAFQFLSREDAAYKLLPELEKFRKTDAVVMAVPRGGVPLGEIIARELDLPLDIVLVKKIGHPMNREYAIGAVSLEGSVIDPNHPEVPEAYIAEQTGILRERLRERFRKYLGDQPVEVLNGRTVILVDDGIATGYTMLATIELLRQKKPAQIILAVPVAPPETVRRLRKYVDELICLSTPPDFEGVGQFYLEFSQVEDDRVTELLESARKRRKAKGRP